MTQLIDMKRLHMGCGESLWRHLPLVFLTKRHLDSMIQATSSRCRSETRCRGKTGREESR
jgi:hypothetical protein